MRMMTWAAAWTGAPEPASERSFSRRSMPPHLSRAIDHERLFFTIHIKGLDPVRVAHMSRGLGINAALREIDRLVPHPPLWPTERAAQRSMADIERWACQEVAPTVLWCLSQSPRRSGVALRFAEQHMHAPIAKALEVVDGLTRAHRYLIGDTLTFADIAAASVLAPVAREQGWTWADTRGATSWMREAAAAWRKHPGAAWVRRFYDLHGQAPHTADEPQRMWLP